MAQGLVFYNPIQMGCVKEQKRYNMEKDNTNILLLKGERVMLKSNLTIDISERVLHFKQPAGTSRGTYLTRRSWFVTVSDGERTGVGECAPLPQLSCDDLPDYERVLHEVCDEVCRRGSIDAERLRPYPSMLFGLETAFLHMERGSSMLFDTPFGRGEEGIPINGLVWMGSHEEMLQRMEEKIKAGFHCVKLKIGAIGFDEELDLIRRLRGRFSRQDIELRVDANGAFSPNEALEKLEQLARYDIHSIEQPIRQGQWQTMAHLCRETPLPIALDEELIGVNDPQEKARLLDTIKPAYIILKPSLHGGMAGSREWITLARERGIGSWITSALESNIGLNAIAHFTAHTYGSDIRMPQGLGTGQLFCDNIPMPLEIRGDRLWVTPQEYESRGYEGTKVRGYEKFLAEWHNDNPRLLVHTSGSTGKPKPLWVEKRRMMASARITCDFLGLKEGDTALLCMSLDYIAGKMMAVRAIERKLKLIVVEPSGHPLKAPFSSPQGEAITFAAMVPMQVWNSLQVPEERERLRRIRHLIIGGGAIDDTLAQELKDFPNAVWSTYGMTETLSHIAMRRLNGPEATEWYTPLSGVKVWTNEEGCLMIDAPHVCDGPLTTNDIAILSPLTPHPSPLKFRILGRKDNVICSGGIKIQAEEVERSLTPHLQKPFAITKRKDEKFGEIEVLITEDSDLTHVEGICTSVLPKYWQPRHFLHVDEIPMTENGKPARQQIAHMAMLS